MTVRGVIAEFESEPDSDSDSDSDADAAAQHFGPAGLGVQR